jgi:hypothetical protein
MFLIFLIAVLNMFKLLHTLGLAENDNYFWFKKGLWMQNISISFLKGVNFIGIIILLKWFDKRWASFYLPLFVFSEAFDILYMKIGNFLFAEKFAQVNDFLIYVSIALTFLMLFVMYYYLPTDPLDYNLIINESAYYLSTRYSENPK